MKKSKLGFCRGDLGLFDGKKILVNKCWLKLWKFPLKCWEGQKSGYFHGAGKRVGGVLQNGVETLHMAFKMTLKDVFPPTLNHTIISWKMKKVWFFEFWAYLRFWVYFVYVFTIKLKIHTKCAQKRKYAQNSENYIFSFFKIW